MLLSEGFCHAAMSHVSTLDSYPSGEWGPRAHAGLKTWARLPGVRMSNGEVRDPCEEVSDRTHGGPDPAHGGPYYILAGPGPAFAGRDMLV